MERFRSDAEALIRETLGPALKRRRASVAPAADILAALAYQQKTGRPNEKHVLQKNLSEGSWPKDLLRESLTPVDVHRFTTGLEKRLKMVRVERDEDDQRMNRLFLWVERRENIRLREILDAYLAAEERTGREPLWVEPVRPAFLSNLETDLRRGEPLIDDLGPLARPPTWADFAGGHVVEAPAAARTLDALDGGKSFALVIGEQGSGKSVAIQYVGYVAITRRNWSVHTLDARQLKKNSRECLDEIRVLDRRHQESLVIVEDCHFAPEDAVEFARLLENGGVSARVKIVFVGRPSFLEVIAALANSKSPLTHEMRTARVVLGHDDVRAVAMGIIDRFAERKDLGLLIHHDHRRLLKASTADHKRVGRREKEATSEIDLVLLGILLQSYSPAKDIETNDAIEAAAQEFLGIPTRLGVRENSSEVYRCLAVLASLNQFEFDVPIEVLKRGMSVSDEVFDVLIHARMISVTPYGVRIPHVTRARLYAHGLDTIERLSMISNELRGLAAAGNHEILQLPPTHATWHWYLQQRPAECDSVVLHLIVPLREVHPDNRAADCLQNLLGTGRVIECLSPHARDRAELSIEEQRHSLFRQSQWRARIALREARAFDTIGRSAVTRVDQVDYFAGSPWAARWIEDRDRPQLTPRFWDEANITQLETELAASYAEYERQVLLLDAIDGIVRRRKPNMDVAEPADVAERSFAEGEDEWEKGRIYYSDDEEKMKRWVVLYKEALDKFPFERYPVLCASTRLALSDLLARHAGVMSVLKRPSEEKRLLEEALESATRAAREFRMCRLELHHNTATDYAALIRKTVKQRTGEDFKELPPPVKPVRGNLWEEYGLED